MHRCSGFPAVYALGLALALAQAIPVSGQFIQRTVGGVAIDPSGALVPVASLPNRGPVRALNAQATPVPEAFRPASGRRVISLRAVEQSIQAALAERGVVPDELRYLGGLVAIHEISVDVAHHDLVIAGPSERWVVGP
ncbi:MAG TPA: hypothetical protein VIY86_03035, partial [Pirellulaceae bacterium]